MPRPLSNSSVTSRDNGVASSLSGQSLQTDVCDDMNAPRSPLIKSTELESLREDRSGDPRRSLTKKSSRQYLYTGSAQKNHEGASSSMRQESGHHPIDGDLDHGVNYRRASADGSSEPSSSQAETMSRDVGENRNLPGGSGGRKDPPAPLRTVTYPSKPVHRQMRQFARSAQKRQSVMMLGSIEHLQHHFTKFGLAAEETPNVKGVTEPAIGRNASRSNGHDLSRFATSSRQGFADIPSTPAPPVTVQPPPYPLDHGQKIDVQSLKKEAKTAIEDLEGKWDHESSYPLPETRVEADQARAIDILDLIQTTIHAIRAVRAYALIAPIQSRPALASTSGGRARQSISTPSRPSLPSAPRQTRSLSSSSNGMVPGSDMPDALSEIRKAALDVLAGLRGIEERFRLQPLPCDDSAIASELPLEPKSGTSVSDGSRSRTSSVTDTTTTHGFESASAPSLNTTIDERGAWADLYYYDGGFRDYDETTWDDADVEGNDGRASKPSWFDGIHSESSAYSADVSIRDMSAEAAAVATYISAVRTHIFPADASRARRAGHARRQRSEIPEVAEDENEATPSDRSKKPPQPRWVSLEGRERIRKFLVDYLPVQMIPQVPAELSELLVALSDGYLLAIAFNEQLISSNAPWGLIPSDDIQDTLNGETGRDWTFRKVENLRAWASAIKARFGISLQLPYQPEAAGKKQHLVPLQAVYVKAFRAADLAHNAGAREVTRKAADGIPIDPVQIAKRETGSDWEHTLETVILKWIDAVWMEMA